jgi:glycosyltransferase involved in cell wall biosynthesis
MCTYNGSKFILEQLESLVRQTCKPYEIIIFDDCSTDDTFDIVQSFSKKHKDIIWIIKRNEHNYGWKVNFKNAINMSMCEYIFLCDQDDIWELNKCEKMLSVISKNSNIELLACNYTLLYQEKNQLVNKFKNYGDVKKIQSSHFLTCIERPGCTYCIRKSIVSKFLSLWDDEFAHDALLWRLAFVENHYISSILMV